jgi:phosphatidate cytidylyltransferase
MIEILDVTSLLGNGLLLVITIIFGVLVFASILIFALSRLKPKHNFSELKSRTRSWWVMATIFILTTLLNTNLSYIALAFLSFTAFRELYSLLDLRTSDRRAIFWALLAIPIQFYLAYIAWYGAYIIFIPVVMFLILPLRLVLKGDTNGIIKSMSTLQWTLMLTVFGLSHLAYLLSLPRIEGFEAGGRGLLLFLVFLTEINDVLQFIWGKLLGENKVIPKVSPNKTWEGLIGGLLCTSVVGYFLAFITPFTPLEAAAVSFLIAFSGFIGDVVMSAIKRDIGVKDTGSTIPGHGGILDRIDSLAYTAPVFFHLTYYLKF